jgi:hypothetical protein
LGDRPEVIAWAEGAPSGENQQMLSQVNERHHPQNGRPSYSHPSHVEVAADFYRKRPSKFIGFRIIFIINSRRPFANPAEGQHHYSHLQKLIDNSPPIILIFCDKLQLQ